MRGIQCYANAMAGAWRCRQLASRHGIPCCLNISFRYLCGIADTEVWPRPTWRIIVRVYLLCQSLVLLCRAMDHHGDFRCIGVGERERERDGSLNWTTTDRRGRCIYGAIWAATTIDADEGWTERCRCVLNFENSGSEARFCFPDDAVRTSWSLHSDGASRRCRDLTCHR
jgi:hypothetical protein